jgi:archaetidylinositol phosphate synthase
MGRDILSHNTWIHRGVRSLVRPLAKTAVTPNQVTTLRLLTGIAAAAAFAVGDDSWRVIGAGIFLLSMILDRADGELARLSGKMSASGHRYDLFADSFCNCVAFVGLGVGYVDTALGAWAAAMGLAAGVAVVAILAMVVRAERVSGARAAELGSGAGFDADDGMLAVPVLVLLDGGILLLYSAAIGAPVFALFFYWRFRSILHPAPSPRSTP